VEIYQNCPIFNDGAFDVLKESGEKERRLIPLVQGEPIRFGVEGEYGVVRAGFGGLEVAKVSEVGEEALVVHDATLRDPSYAFALSQLSTQDLQHTVTGIYRNVVRPTYDDLARTQLADARTRKSADLQALLSGKDTWTVAG
jgi:2-oxoglutarate ferredoxin oxidoreductase subunit beta